MMLINIPKEINQILDLIRGNGYKAYIVGGYIRDYLLNIESFDVDITTSATPDVLKEMFENYKLEESFIGLGCIKFEFGRYHIEITTFRKEYAYINHRKPSKVEFSSFLEEDLRRRDFTINALCCDGGQVIDLFNGIQDLKDRKIKTIGNSNCRFEEDALRILRALRFASKLNFELDKDTCDSAFCNCKYLSSIAFETKYRELKGILEGENFCVILDKYKEILKEAFLLEDLKINLFNEDMGYEEKEALFFYYSNININNKYLINKDVEIINNKISIKKIMNKYGKENVYNLLFFRSSVIKENIKEFITIEEIISNNECYNLKMLDVNGEDLLNVGIKNNKIGKHLNMLLDAVIENKCLNEKKQLLEYLKNNILD